MKIRTIILAIIQAPTVLWFVGQAVVVEACSKLCCSPQHVEVSKGGVLFLGPNI